MEYNIGQRFLLEQVIEACPSNPERMKEGLL
jgi:hypothetical protein